MTELHDFMFSDLTQMNNLTLKNNYISHIDRDSFKYAKLRKLYLEGNEVTSVKWMKHLRFNIDLGKFICPAFDNLTCNIRCNQSGLKSPVIKYTHKKCKDCICQCPKCDCQKHCHGNPYKLYKNHKGCLKCKCFCPKINCDAQCGGEGLGVVGPKDE